MAMEAHLRIHTDIPIVTIGRIAIAVKYQETCTNIDCTAYKQDIRDKSSLFKGSFLDHFQAGFNFIDLISIAREPRIVITPNPKGMYNVCATARS